MDDHLGARKGLAQQCFHFVGNFMGFQQGHVAIELQVDLNESIRSGGTRAQVVQPDHPGVRERDLFDPKVAVARSM